MESFREISLDREFQCRRGSGPRAGAPGLQVGSAAVAAAGTGRVHAHAHQVQFSDRVSQWCYRVSDIFSALSRFGYRFEIETFVPAGVCP